MNKEGSLRFLVQIVMKRPLYDWETADENTAGMKLGTNFDFVVADASANTV
jgi:hypothetical protein